MRSLLITSLFLFFITLGLRHSFVLVLGYIWIDVSTPQRIAYQILPLLPVSMIMGTLAIAFTSIRAKFHLTRHNVLLGFILLLLAGWGTVSLSWAVAPIEAQFKWQWATANLVFMAFLAVSIQTRREMEAVLLALIFSAAIHTIPYGTKTLVSGGGYGYELGIVGGNFGLAESSTLSVFVVALVPLGLYLHRHSDLIPFGCLGKLGLGALSIASLLTAVGTHARAGLLALGILVTLQWLASSRKLINLVVVSTLLIAGQSLLTESWRDRMSTLNALEEEESAMGRVAVWVGTIDYVKRNPLGGSFNSYHAIEGDVSLGDSGRSLSVQNKAFHSIYFEVLGELGIPGALLYASMILVSLWSLLSTRRRCKDSPNSWGSDLGRALLFSGAIMFLGGSVIGIAFQPFALYFIALAGAYPSVASVLIRKSNTPSEAPKHLRSRAIVP